MKISDCDGTKDLLGEISKWTISHGFVSAFDDGFNVDECDFFHEKHRSIVDV